MEEHRGNLEQQRITRFHPGRPRKPHQRTIQRKRTGTHPENPNSDHPRPHGQRKPPYHTGLLRTAKHRRLHRSSPGNPRLLRCQRMRHRHLPPRKHPPTSGRIHAGIRKTRRRSILPHILQPRKPILLPSSASPPYILEQDAGRRT